MKRLSIALVLLLGIAAATLYLSPATLLTTVQWVELHRAGLSPKQLQVDDLTIHYYEGGRADQETLVMIHGFGANKDNWLRFARYFTSDYHVIALDLPGFGESSQPDVAYDAASQMERLVRVVKALGLGRVHLIGNSMGGQIAALYAARHPQGVASVALVDNAGITPPQQSELFARLQRGEPNPLVVKTAEDFPRLLDFVFVDVPSMPKALQQHFAQQAIANSGHYENIFRQLVEHPVPLEPELPNIQVPVLVLWGDRDRTLHVSSVEVMRPLLRQSRVVIMKDCGHVPMLERPEETAGHYQAFLDNLANSTPSVAKGA
ncbi:MAG: alpha/beta hydrolase [Pseudomonas sp.]|uniref:alpha/beta fold hydrolase n=1 Tax=Pseudomonas sp. TaxID=306 RepID=UPI003393C9D4